MSQAESEATSVSLSVENVGGISETEVTLSRGVTVLTGRNATNRTSLLRAIMAVLGSDDVALKGDASEGSVELSIGNTTYNRRLQRRSGTVVFDGDPYLEESELADLFAFLLESNDARRAVERGDDLSEVIMRPVDTDAIETEIADLRDERQELQAELEEIEALAERLPVLEEERRDLESRIEEKRREVEETRKELDSLEADREQITEVDERFDELRETRNRLENIRNEIEDEERVLEALREDRAELQDSLDGLGESDAEAVAELESEIGRLRDRAADLESTVSQLQSAIQFNEDMLNESRPELLDRGPDSDDGSPTDRLVAKGEPMVCWTCGSEVDRAAIEQTIDLLRDAYGEKLDERNALREEIDELETEKRHLERTAEERTRLNRELEETATEFETRTDRLDELRETAESLESTVEDLENAVDDLQSDGEDQRIDLYRQATEQEVELKRLEEDLDELEAEIESIEERIDRGDELESAVETINDEIEERRSRIERIRADVVEQFNDNMSQLLDRLEFQNLERIWIERVDAGDGDEAFDLHVVRTNESGSVYEDTVDHLSESEREVVGLVFALSGYRVYEVYDQLPFMLLDSLEALDSGRIATLVEYIAERADNLVVALLPEDAAAVDDSYRRLTDI